jgi:hypothetical protein
MFTMFANIFEMVRDVVAVNEAKTAIAEKAETYRVLHLIKVACEGEMAHLKPDLLAYEERYGKAPIDGIAFTHRKGSMSVDNEALEAFLVEHGATLADFKTKQGADSTAIRVKNPSEQDRARWFDWVLAVK